MNYVLRFIVSTILSGITWDCIKGTQKHISSYFLRKTNIAVAELKNIIENIPEDEKESKKRVLEYLKEDREYQILLAQAVKHVTGTNLKRRIVFAAVAVFIALVVKQYYSVLTDKQLRTFSNDYVQVVYNGLKKKELPPTSREGDIFFYNSIWDLKNKKYIRVVKFHGRTDLEESINMINGDENEKMMFVDICQSQQIYHALNYAELELELVETQGLNGDFKNKIINGDEGFTIGIGTTSRTMDNISNAVLVQYTNSNYKYFLIARTLYADESGYMMALLSYSGMSYEDFINSYDKK